MKDFTSQDINQLLGKIKSFLNISWNDTDTNSELTDFIYSSIKELDRTAGSELDYLLVPTSEQNSTEADKLYNEMCYLGQDLLKNRVFYLREKALDDFKKNYLSDLNNLYILGKIYKVKKNANEQ